MRISHTRELRICRAARLLAAGQTPEEVARAVHAKPETVARWQADEDFRALVDCLRTHGQARRALDALGALTDEAIDRLRQALAGDDDRLALQAAQQVLDRVGLVRRSAALGEETAEQVIRVEYVNPEGQPISTAPWAARNPASSGALQGGGVRAPLREDGDGQDSPD